MPRRTILLDAELTSLLAPPDTEAELIHRYTFSDADLAIIAQHRGPANRLGFAVQLCYMRYSGVVLAAGDVPPTLFRRVATQLKLSPEHWTAYGKREQTRRQRLVELQAVFGFQPFGKRHYRSAVHNLEELAWKTDSVSSACRRSASRTGSDVTCTRTACSSSPVKAVRCVRQSWSSSSRNAEAAFITARDSFYLASVSETGWPYIQHRGGPAGFLRVVDVRTLAFTDLSGNRQLLSTENVTGDNDCVALFLMDYPNRTRLKIMGHAKVIDAREQPALAAQFAPHPSLLVRTERLFFVEVVSFDWNCPQHITPQFTIEEFEAAYGT